MKKFLANGSLIDILRVEIKIIICNEIKNILIKTPVFKDEIILLSGIPIDTGALGTPNFELNKEKEVMSMPEDIEDDYQERFL